MIRARNSTQLVLMLAIAVVLFRGGALHAEPPVESLPDRVESISRSVVLVWFQESDRGYASYGTGFALDTLGHILTCAHVVQEKSMVTIAVPTGDKEINYPASVIAVNLDLDAAILKVEGVSLQGLRINDKPPVRPGEQVGFVGYPLGYTVDTSFGPSLTIGYVSAVRKWRVSPTSPKIPMIQVDGTVAIGTSGSPLFRIDSGEVVGMMKSHVKTPGPIASRENVLGAIEAVPDELATYAGIGLALPMSHLADFIERSGVQLVR